MWGIFMGLRSILASSAVLSLCASPAYADDKRGGYANIGLTQVSADLDLSNTNISGNNLDLGEQSADILMLTGRFGYRFVDFLAVEAEGSFGLGGDNFQTSIPVVVDGFGSVNVDTDVDLDISHFLGVFARGILPVSDQLELHARVGYGTAEVEATATGTVAGFGSTTASQSESVDDFAYGFGGQFNVNERMGLRLDYTSLGGDANIIAGTVAFKF